jgi:large subunit ribosomal protein L1
MAYVSKRRRALLEKVGNPNQPRAIDDALAWIKTVASAKFDETVDVAFNLGVDPRKSDQVVRGSTVLPHGTGKTVRVAVFADGADGEAARAAGADVVGFDDLAEQIKAGNINFDVAIATPASMRIVGQLGQILGPRGLMPNPKVGTVTPDVAGAVRNAKAGQIRYRTDKAGIIHCPIGKASFEVAALKANFEAILSDLKKAKPSTAKGIYLRQITVSCTMGPGIAVDRASVETV